MLPCFGSVRAYPFLKFVKSYIIVTDNRDRVPNENRESERGREFMISRVRVEIYNSKYTIATPESEEHVQKLAKDLDTQIKQFVESNERATLNDALVLIAMNYADSYYKSEQGADHMRAQLTDYLEEAARAKLELEEAKKQIEHLEKRLKHGG